MRHAAILIASAMWAQDFEADLQPVFRKYCLGCHAQTVKMGSLDLETVEGIRAGGNHGTIVVPGKANESRLYLMSAGKKEPFMPMDGRSLAPAELEILRKWIDNGAKGPARPAPVLSSQSIPEILPRETPKPQTLALAQSPDGSLLALGGYKIVRLRETRSGTEKILSGHRSAVRAVAISRDGKYLAAGGGLPAQGGEVKIWNLETQTVAATIQGHADCVYAVAFSPDGRTLATASYDKMIYLWDAASGKQVRALKDHVDAVYSLVFSSGGTRLLSASADRSVKVWDPATGERLFTLSEPADALQTVAISPNGKFVAAGGNDKTIRLWELSEKSGTLKNSLIAHEDTVLHLAFSPDGTMLASASADRAVKLFRTSDLTELTLIGWQTEWPSGLVFSPDGRQLVVSRLDGLVQTYPISQQQVANK